MPNPNINVSLYPNVPAYPGVPQLNRLPGFSVPPALNIAAPSSSIQNALLPAVKSAVTKWGVFDSNNVRVITPDSVLEFYHRPEWRVSNFPVQDGGFASYNKVQLPFEISVRLSKGGSQDDRATFLSQIDAIAGDTNFYTIRTPERSYQNVNVTRYEVSRRGVGGAFFLTEVDVFFIQIVQVTAQYSSTAAATQNAQQPDALPPVNQGTVAAAPAGPVNYTVSPITGIFGPSVNPLTGQP